MEEDSKGTGLSNVIRIDDDRVLSAQIGPSGLSAVGPLSGPQQELSKPQGQQAQCACGKHHNHR
jgi:hypothetical protein